MENNQKETIQKNKLLTKENKRLKKVMENYELLVQENIESKKNCKNLKEEINELERIYLNAKKNYIENKFPNSTKKEDVAEILIDLYEKSSFNKHLQKEIEKLLLNRNDIDGFDGNYFVKE